MELDKNQHSVYSINYHLVMVIKYRRKVISDEISGYLRATFERIGITYGVELVEWNHDKDHVRLRPGAGGLLFPSARCAHQGS